MTTARVQAELDVVADLVSSLDENSERVAQGFVDALERADPKSKLPVKAVREVLDGVRHALVSCAAKAKSADEGLEAELGDDAPLMAKRDRQSARMNKRLVSLRALILSNVGPEAVTAAGFVGATPDDAEALVTLAGKVHRWLTQANPKSAHAFAEFNAKLAAKGLDDEAAALEASVKALRKEKREEQTARNGRDGALVALTELRGGAAPMLSAMYRVAGFDQLADRLVANTPTASSSKDDAEDEKEKEPEGEKKGGPTK